MKKLIVLSVIFALVASFAFAADVGGAVIAHADLVRGSTAEAPNSDGVFVNPDLKSGTAFPRIRLSAAGATEDDSIGGWIRYDQNWYDLAGGFRAVSPSGFAWWKPIDQIKLQIGVNPDGEFGLDGVARWNFYQLAGDVGVASEHWGLSGSFYGGYGEGGIVLTITPVDALAINIGIPLDEYGHGSTTGKNFAKSTIQVKYNIEGIGTAGLTYVSDVNDPAEPNPAATGVTNMFKSGWNDTGKVYVYFGLSAIENLGIDIGIGYKFADKYTREITTNVVYKITTKATYTVNDPVAIGVGIWN